MAEILKEHAISLQKEAPIKGGALDPYLPKNKQE